MTDHFNSLEGVTSDGLTQFRVLGPLEIYHNGSEIELSAPMQRKLLLCLLLDPGRVVSAGRLQGVLWPDSEVDKSKALRFHVSRMRSALGDSNLALVKTVGDGYQLMAESSQVDSFRFTQLVESALAVVEDDPADALRACDEALAMWRGSPYVEAESVDFSAEISRLKELRLSALEVRMDALLELGRHEEAAADLSALVEEYPLREKFRGQQMVALYRSGRTAEALRAYDDTRRTLGEELGIEPSAALAELEEKILLGEKELLSAPVPMTGVNTVPRHPGKLIGREADLDQVARLFEGSRLTTLTGIGGVGKTRLAQAFALDHDHGSESVWWVSLVGVADDAQAISVIHESLGLGGAAGSSLEHAFDFLRKRRALVILDNCESSMVVARSFVEGALNVAPGVSFLTTSLVPLGVAGEVVYQVPRLGTEGEPDSPSPAVSMLATLSAADGHPIADQDMPWVASVVRRLGGVPLALELAAARLRALTPQELDKRLGKSIAALEGAPAEESIGGSRVLATIEWSVELLSEQAQDLFARLGVFAGSFSLDAVQSVCVGRGLARDQILPAIEEMVAASLIEHDSTPSVSRYGLLDAVGELARIRWRRSDGEQWLLEEHARHYADLADELVASLRHADQVSDYDRLEQDEGNLRRAFSWGVEHDREVALRSALGLANLWQQRGSPAEARQLLAETLADAGHEPAYSRASAAGTLSLFEATLGDMVSARRWLVEVNELADSLAVYELSLASRLAESEILWREGATRASIDTLSDALRELGPRSDPLAVYMLRAAGLRRAQVGDLVGAARDLEDLGWWADHEHPFARAARAEVSGDVAHHSHNPDVALSRLDAAIAAYRTIGARVELVDALNGASMASLAVNDLDRTANYALEARKIGGEIGAFGAESLALSLVGYALLRTGRPDSARKNLMQAADLAIEAVASVELAWAASFLAAYMSVVGRHEAAVVLYSAADESGQAMGLLVPHTLAVYRQADLERLSTALGPDVFEGLEQTGRALPLDSGLLEKVTR